MHRRSRRPLQDALTAIRLGCALAEAGLALHANGERHLRSRRRLAWLSVNVFLKSTWTSPETTTERDVQDFLIAQRDSGVARETFRGYRYALQFLFVNTLRRDWPLFKKN